MCGIAGILSSPGVGAVAFEDLRRMIALLEHRGPDGYGFFRDGLVGLASARLSIVDLAGGFQPIHNEDRSIWLTFNGEIFNFVELRRDLVSRGHRFYTACDSEVIVHAFEEHGPLAWQMLNGQFAIALWDAKRRQLWLVRDRLGIHPIHFARAGRSVVFGSEAKALFASGLVEPSFDASGLAQVFTRWSAAAPATVFRDVRQVRPGTAICIDAEDLGETEHVYWTPRLDGDPALATLSDDGAADALDDLLRTSVRLRLQADVPVGAYLSGGLDSSVVASLVRTADSSPLSTFSVRFDDPAFDETVDQRRMAALLGTEHHEVVCGAPEIQDALPEVVWHCESPLLRTAPAPLYLLSGLVRDNGMKVVLTGEGADELLAGYNIFKEDKVRRFWAREPASRVRPGLLARLHPEVAGGQVRDSELWQRFFGRRLTETDHPFYSHMIRWENTAWTARVLAPDVRAAVDLERMNREAALELPGGWSELTPLARAQWLEIQTFMSSYLLSCQGDRVALGHGVEVRYPFLDPAVVDFCLALPGHLKMPGLRDKVTLRRLASRSLPPEIWRRPKVPYRAPTTSALFRHPEPDYMGELLSEEAIARVGLADAKAAGVLVSKARRQGGRMSGEREEMALVGLITLQLLGHRYGEDLGRRVREGAARFDESRVRVLEDASAEAGAVPALEGGS
jgi:asparagine synthase (glutamine-hydrolysing)